MNLFPEAPQSDFLQFHIARGLSYSERLRWIMGLIVVGLFIEWFFLIYPLDSRNLLMLSAAGCAPLIGAFFLMLTVGYSNKPVKLPGAGFWKTAPIEKIQEIASLCKRSRSWDVTFLDITNPLGFFTMAAFGVGVVIISGIALSARPFSLAGPLVVINALCLFLPIWLSGIRSGYSNAELLNKTELMMDLINHFQTIRNPDENLQASLKLSDSGEKAVPLDAKLMVTWSQANPDFYGVQGQININQVQGKSYPYGYFVVIGKRGLNLDVATRGLDFGNDVTVEYDTQGDVEIVVVRQTTTRTTGYHTKPSKCRELLSCALTIARQVAQLHPK